MKLHIVALFLFFTSISAYQSYCRCQCLNEYNISPVNSCGGCTPQYCIDTADICKENIASEVGVNCFQIESLKDQLVVYGFLTVVVLLLGYGIGGERLRRFIGR